MSKQHTNSILSFYAGLRKDLKEILPEFSPAAMDASFDWVDTLLREDNHRGVALLSTLGKRFEMSLIDRSKLELPAGIPKQFGTELPEPFFELFAVLFSNGGVPFSAVSMGGDIDATCVMLLRQILLAFSKLKDMDCAVSESDELAAFKNRITRLPRIDSTIASNALSYARYLLREVLADGYSRRLSAPLAQWESNPFGRHGPGAVAKKEKGACKWNFGTIPGVDSNLFDLHPGRTASLLRGPASLEARCSRLAIVPKDFRGHRLICVEPKELMFAQQGLMSVIYDLVHSHPLTRKSINFDDQRASQVLSRNPLFSTIDLKDASDHVSKTLARMLLPREVFRLLTRFRSDSIDLGRSIVTNVETLFTMGNALCFPVETLIFWALALGTMVEEEYPNVADAVRILRDPSALVRRFRIRVFGDDIIVPRIHFEAVTAVLESVGFTVNRAKSCSDTPVREACGSWWYRGYDARITRFQYHLLTDPLVWLAWHDNAIQLAESGLNHSCEAIFGLMAEMHTPPRHIWGLQSQMVKSECYRWNIELQRVEYLKPSPAKGRYKSLPGDTGLYAYFTDQATSTLTGRGHNFKTESVWTPLF